MNLDLPYLIGSEPEDFLIQAASSETAVQPDDVAVERNPMNQFTLRSTLLVAQGPDRLTTAGGSPRADRSTGPGSAKEPQAARYGQGGPPSMPSGPGRSVGS